MCEPTEYTTTGIAADTLFHFTDSIENLIGILTNEFMPRYSLEGLSVVGEVTDDEASNHAIPMVCFCDLPVSRLHEHLDFYGSYGIGMSKEWGKRNGVSPVSYMYPQAMYLECFQNLGRSIAKAIPKPTVPNKPPHPVYDFIELVSYIKPYQGKAYRNGEFYTKRFYDEREWRYVPMLSRHKEAIDAMVPPRLTRDEFMNDKTKDAANLRIGNVIRLGFEPDDIKYIFVKCEEEIISLVRDIERIKDKYSSRSVKLLTTRIMSSEQVAADF